MLSHILRICLEIDWLAQIREVCLNFQKLQGGFQSDCSNLWHCHKQGLGVLISPYYQQLSEKINLSLTDFMLWMNFQIAYCSFNFHFSNGHLSICWFSFIIINNNHIYYLEKILIWIYFDHILPLFKSFQILSPSPNTQL